LDENVTAFDSAKSSVEYAYNESLSLIRHSADSVGSYSHLEPLLKPSDLRLVMKFLFVLAMLSMDSMFACQILDTTSISRLRHQNR
jgi:hypothetical protein